MPSEASRSIPSEIQRRLRVDEYHRMISAGVFDEDEHVELLEGVVVAMTPQAEPHARVIQRLTRALNRGLGDEYLVRPQLPLTLGADSEPEPDLAVVRAAEAQSKDRHPGSALLVIEVATDSPPKDRMIKGALYARAGVPEYWIVNVLQHCVEVYRDPEAAVGRYRTLITLDPGQSLVPSTLPGLSIPVADLLS